LPDAKQFKPVANPCKTVWQCKWLALDCYRPEIQEMADKAEQFCKRWCKYDRDKSLLVLAGESNCGKTHTAKSIYHFGRAAAFTVFENGRGLTWKNIPSIAYHSWPMVADAFKEGRYSVVDDMMEADLLVLDDLGAEHDPSKNATGKLCQVLSRREHKHTVITTNIKLEEWAVVFDTRIADRLLRNSEVVTLFGLPSYATL
jgi:hypothetical protein